MSDVPFKNVYKLAKRAEKIRNYQKQVLPMIKHCLGKSEINTIMEKRSFLHNFSLQDKHKGLRVQLARADVTHSNRAIKGIFDPEKLTFSINPDHKSI